MISFFVEVYNKLFRPRRSKSFHYLMDKLVVSTDEVVELKNKLHIAEEALRVIQDENTILWQQLDEIKESDRATVRQMNAAMEDAYLRALKPIGDA